jgi:GT2 family glycosyltransferase
MNLSIIICCHNKLSSLPHVVRGLKKNGGDHEYILSDDNSTDGSLKWTRASDFFHKILHCGPDGGKYKLCKIRNDGVDNASNNHVVILDADCVPEETFIDGHIDMLSFNGGNIISVGFTNHYDENGKDMIHNDHRLSYDLSSGSCPIGWRDSFGGNISFSKDIFYRVNKFDEDYDGEWGFEDLDFAFRATRMGIPIRANKKAIARHLRHPVSKDYNGSNLKGRNNDLFFKKNGIRPC